MESLFKSPYALLPDSLAISTQEELSRLARRLKKEYLAEFDVGNKAHLYINGKSWLRSEVIDALEDFANPKNTHHLIIIRQGWKDFWNGAKEIPESIRDLSQLPERDFSVVKSSLISVLVHKTLTALLAWDTEHILALLKVASILPVFDQDKINQCVFRFLHREATAMSEWSTDLSNGLRKDEVNQWFPLKSEALICSLPKRFSSATEQYARIRLNASDILSRSITSKKQRRILAPSSVANPHWSPYLKTRWNGYSQYLKGLPNEQELSTPVIITTTVAVAFAMLIGGMLSGGSNNRVELYDPPGLADSLYKYSPADWVDPVDWTNLDSGLRHSLRQLDSLHEINLDTLLIPELPEIQEHDWAEILKLKDSIISSGAYRRLSDSVPADSVPADSAPTMIQSQQDSSRTDSISLSIP